MFKCIISTCPEKANYNKKESCNPAYCYEHKTKDMVKKGSYDVDDIIEILCCSFENIIKKWK